jgi:naphthoate synthase
MTEPVVLSERVGSVLWLTLNRPDAGNGMTPELLIDLRTKLDEARLDTETRVIVLTGAGTKFFCVGGEKPELPADLSYATVMPVVDVYQSIHQHPKPIIAAVNGYAVGGGNVLQVMCDLTIAAESAVFRQVGPMVGSFDAGFGTWMLEDLVGTKRAKQMWMLNDKLSAPEALAWDLINFVVPDDLLRKETQKLAEKLASRGSIALAAVKQSFAARHGGVGGFSRVAHDLLLRQYLATEESGELNRAFGERREPDPSRFSR